MKRIGLFGKIAIVFVLLAIIGAFSGDSDEMVKTDIKTTEEVNVKESTLQENYNRHKNYIWLVCKEGLKLISTGSNITGPTFAGEIDGKFYVEGEEDGNAFVCEFIKYDNKRGMNLVDVRLK